jgi:hypothetical protein
MDMAAYRVCISIGQVLSSDGSIILQKRGGSKQLMTGEANPCVSWLAGERSVGGEPGSAGWWS